MAMYVTKTLCAHTFVCECVLFFKINFKHPDREPCRTSCLVNEIARFKCFTLFNQVVRNRYFDFMGKKNFMKENTSSVFKLSLCMCLSVCLYVFLSAALELWRFDVWSWYLDTVFYGCIILPVFFIFMNFQF